VAVGSSCAASGTGRSESVRLGPGLIARIVAHAEIEAVRRAVAPLRPGAADHPTDPLVEVPAEIATARERAERTFPPDWWMGGSHCRGDV
jgi:hypothetical protein